MQTVQVLLFEFANVPTGQSLDKTHFYWAASKYNDLIQDKQFVFICPHVSQFESHSSAIQISPVLIYPDLH